ncbi:guanylate-binding protein 4-like [Hyperolius riggenbachi]|uniref:guanylate-binding protein 4-like n=1 Tax=Hyperolius riggenbachi TaxID=752182 RepID=UPI0035A36ECA
MKTPIPLIENVGKLVVNPKAIQFLNTINKPIVPVAMVGMYRSGKSYLMNRLADAQTGFELGSAVEAKTKGIWMWCTRHPIKKDHILMLLDTEGLGDVGKKDNNNDTNLFALAVLLSSALVYNSKNTIDNDAVEKLKFVGDLTELIKVRSQGNKNQEGHFSRYFPIFIWTVRDFHLGLQVEGKAITEDEYLDKALSLKTSANTHKEKEFNKLRERLRMYFGTRKCFVFGLPTSNTQDLQRLDEVPVEALNVKFVNQCKKFREYILQNVKEKKVKDIFTVTGQVFGELTKFYTEAINSSKGACLEDAVESLSEKENAAAIQKATEYYEAMMKKVAFPTDTQDHFLDLSKPYEIEAEKIFRQSSFRDENERFLETFVEAMSEKRKEFMTMNEDTSREICNAVIKKHTVVFENALRDQAYLVPGGYERFKQDLKTLEEKYKMEHGKGVMAEEVLQKYLKSKQEIELTIRKMDRTLSYEQKKKEEDYSKREEQERAERIRREEEAWRRKKLEEDNARLMEIIGQLKKQMEEERRMMEERLENLIKEKEKEMHFYMDEKLEEQAKVFQEQINEIKREKKLEMDKAKEKEKSPLFENFLFSKLRKKKY